VFAVLVVVELVELVFEVFVGRPVQVSPAVPVVLARSLYWSTVPQNAYFRVLLVQVTLKPVQTFAYVRVEPKQV
jgi:hypothetical protein